MSRCQGRLASILPHPRPPRTALTFQEPMVQKILRQELHIGEAGEGREDNGGLGWHAVSEDLGLYATPELGISLYMELRTILTFEETYGSTR